MDFLDRQQERYRRWEEEDREWRRIQEEKADAKREQLRIEEEQRHSEQKKEAAWRSESPRSNRHIIILTGLMVATCSLLTSLVTALIKYLAGEL